MAAEPPRSGLLIDWGGVLTTNLFASFHADPVPESRGMASFLEDRIAEEAGAPGAEKDGR